MIAYIRKEQVSKATACKGQINDLKNDRPGPFIDTRAHANVLTVPVTPP